MTAYAPIIVRSDKPDEGEKVSALLRASFDDEFQVRVNEHVRSASGFDRRLSLVADRAGELLGYVLHFDVSVEAGPGIYKAAHMGPVAVPARYADQGVGERLIRHGMQRAASLGYELVLAMGPYDHFHRFGFLSARVQGFSSNFQLSDDVFLVRRLDEQPIGAKRGKVLYPEHILAAATA